MDFSSWKWHQLLLQQDLDWARIGGWAFTATAGFFVTSIGILFPLQVKYQAPEASMKQIYNVLWDCVADMTKPEEPKYRTITTKELVQLLEDDPSSVVVVDTRTEEDFRTGHIEGSVFIPFNTFRDDFCKLPKDKKVVLTCQFGHYSIVAAKKMLRAGYTKVYDHAAGMEEWAQLKKPTAKGFAPKDNDKAIDAISTTTSNKLQFTKDPKQPIYMDYNATTPLDPRVLETMMPYLTNQFGNAASRTHGYGTVAERAVYIARQQVASAIGASSEKEIVFTSGASESNNLAIKGVAYWMRNWEGKQANNKNHIITCVTEHKAVLDTCKALELDGFDVTHLQVNSDGLIEMEDLARAMKPTTILVSIMLANNEIGVIQPFQKIGQLCHDRGVIFHTDGTQGVGKIDLNVQRDHIDLMSISAHKIYGPKGVGALYVRPSVQLQEQINGGAHEFGMRSGTLNVPGIVGLGECCHIAVEERIKEGTRIQGLRDRLLQKLSKDISHCQVNGSMTHRLGGNLHMSFAGVTSEEILVEVSGAVAISSGSACNSRKTGPSHVVTALDMPVEMMGCTLRFGVGRFTTEEEIDFVAKRLIEAITLARKEKEQAAANK